MKRFILFLLLCTAAVGSSASPTNEKIRAYALCKVTEFYIGESVHLTRAEFQKACDCNNIDNAIDSIKKYVSTLQKESKGRDEVTELNEIILEIIDNTKNTNADELFASLHKRLQNKTSFPATAAYLEKKKTKTLLEEIEKKIAEETKPGSDGHELDSLKGELNGVQNKINKLNDNIAIKYSNFVITGGILFGVLSIVNLILLVRLRRSETYNDEAQSEKGEAFDDKKEGAPENIDAQTNQEVRWSSTGATTMQPSNMTTEEINKLKEEKKNRGNTPLGSNDSKPEETPQTPKQNEDIRQPIELSIDSSLPVKAEKIYFAPAPEPGGYFIDDYMYDEFKLHASIYQIKINPSNPNQATYSIADRRDAHEFALQFPSANIEPVCIFENAHFVGAKSIQTLKRGKLEKENDKWVVREKARIFFDDKPFVES